MNRLTKEQLNKLPKWAQRHIRMLENELENRDKQSHGLFSADPAEVEVELPYFYSADGVNHDHQPLPSRQSVKFYLPHPDPRRKNAKADIVVKLDHMRGGILVIGSDPLGITPNVSNSVNVRIVKI